jgi:colanic acid biosynthesis glycosyl transferase WcaI
MLVPHYAPDLGPSAPLFTMLSTELAKRGHQMIILTAVPHYPTGEVPAPFRKKFIQRSLENGIEIIRIRVPSLKRSNFAGRLLQFICYQLGATWAGFSKKYDTVFVANPALWVWLPFTCLCVIRRKPAIFSIYDVYPDVGIRLGIFKNKLVIKGVTALERYCLKHSRIVRIISESFRPGMHRLGVPDSKIALIYDWVDTDLIQPLPKETPFAKAHGLDKQFVVLYAGNLGLSQGLENILFAAEQLVAQQDILFVLVGDGAGRKSLVEEAERRQIHNVRFIPFQARELIPEVLASADVSLVVLKKGIGFESLPSKILSILASNRPIIASIDEGCEAWNLIQKAAAGLCVPPENPTELVNAILSLKNDKDLCEQMGKNGRKWALLNHSPQVAAEVFERLFQSTISTSKSK